MTIHVDHTGKLLLDAGGRLRTCDCCVEDDVDEYRLVANCCNQCEGVYIKASIIDACPFPGSVKRVNGRCYRGNGPIVTRAEAEATGRPVISDPADVECNATIGTDCTGAQVSGECPPCSECCLQVYLSKECFVNPPDNTRTSVCCNWGRQALLVVTFDEVNQGGSIDANQVLVEGCTCTMPPLVAGLDRSFTRVTQCRLRRRCPANLGCDALLSTFVQTGYDAGTGDAGCNCTTLPNDTRCLGNCSSGGNVTSEAVRCGPVVECQFASCREFETYTSQQCARNCFSGSSELVNESRRYWTVFCPCEENAQFPGCTTPPFWPCGEFQCTLREYTTLIQRSEWSIIIEDQDGCDADNVCQQYNGGCLEVDGLGPVDDICSEDECVGIEDSAPPPPAPLVVPGDASAWGNF